MLKVSAAEFQRNLDRYQDAARHQPVAVQRRARDVLGLDDFTDADIAALKKAKAPAKSRTFDPEIK